jgi:hypothetical protein
MEKEWKEETTRTKEKVKVIEQGPREGERRLDHSASGELALIGKPHTCH